MNPALSPWEASIGAVRTVGPGVVKPGSAKLDLAKNVLQAHGADAEVRAAFRKTLRRGQTSPFFPHSTERGRDQAKRLVAWGAFWAREFGERRQARRALFRLRLNKHTDL